MRMIRKFVSVLVSIFSGIGCAVAADAGKKVLVTYGVGPWVVGEARLEIRQGEKNYFNTKISTNLSTIVNFGEKEDICNKCVASTELKKQKIGHLDRYFEFKGEYPTDFSGILPAAMKYGVVEMQIINSNIIKYRADVLVPEPPDFIKIDKNDLNNVTDPLNALIIDLAGKRFDKKTCDRTIKLFDGYMRANIFMYSGQLHEVQEPPYRGMVLDCRVRWQPISGYPKNGEYVNFMINNRDIKVRLVPVLDGRILVPLSISVGTYAGNLMINAKNIELIDDSID